MTYTPLKYFFHFLLGRHDGELKYLILLDLVVLFIMLTAAVFTYVMLERVRKTRRQKANEMVVAKFEELLSEIMFGDFNDPALMEAMKIFNQRYIRRAGARSNALTAELMRIFRQFTGETAARVRSFFVFSDLIYHSTAKLKSYRWNVVVEGINDLSEMQVAGAYDKIVKHIDSPNIHLRESSQLAILRIRGAAALERIAGVKQTITLWQQVNIMHVALDFNPANVPDLSEWLKAANPSVAELGLRLVVHFQQTHLLEENTQMLGHSKLQVVNTYLWAIGEMYAPAALEKAIAHYTSMAPESRLELLKAIERAGSNEHLGFLSAQLGSDNFDVRFTALRGIKKCAGGDMIRQLAISSTTLELQRMTGQLLNEG